MRFCITPRKVYKCTFLRKTADIPKIQENVIRVEIHEITK